jgi:hypothetical protein
VTGTSAALAATGTNAPLGASGTSDPTGAGSGSAPTVQINPSNVLGSQPIAPQFLYSVGSTATQPGQAGTGSSGQGYIVPIRAGTDFVQNFDLARGDQLDLTGILAGAPLAHDLANIANFVQVLSSGSNDPGFGSGIKTSLAITGPQSSAVVNLEGAGKLELKDLLQHHSLLLPPH